MDFPSPILTHTFLNLRGLKCKSFNKKLINKCITYLFKLISIEVLLNLFYIRFKSKNAELWTLSQATNQLKVVEINTTSVSSEVEKRNGALKAKVS